MIPDDLNKLGKKKFNVGGKRGKHLFKSIFHFGY